MDAQTLREVMGGNLPNGGYTRLIDGYQRAMRAAGVTNVRRAAMWAAQLGHAHRHPRHHHRIDR